MTRHWHNPVNVLEDGRFVIFCSCGRSFISKTYEDVLDLYEIHWTKEYLTK